MYDGQLLPLTTYDFFTPLLACMISGLALTVLLRTRFDREWKLTLWTVYRIKRVWQRLADESARTGGTLTSHLMGISAWGIMGSAWAIYHATSELDQLMRGMWVGLLIGAVTLILRHLAAALGGWITLTPEATQRGAEIDRHMRNWLLWILIVVSLFWMNRGIIFEERIQIWHSLLMCWWLWLGLKWMRQLQSILHERLHFGWGIAYICTFEIGPTWWLFLQL